ncbi:MAG: pyruvate, water dikinase [Pseudonocardiales bacterium]|jgi:pyruvate,water dikinase|nr:Phosphoenolpyruvate synthase [Pseudonocardiales bacterium]MDT4971493.1 pyruvate, water dikinase [Pseudonocardiales bacterium]
MRNVIWFDTFSADERACLGGKSASLGELMNAGLPVPPGFAVTTHAFRSAREGSGVVEAIRARLDGLDPSDVHDVTTRAAAVRELIMSWPLPEPIGAEIRAAYQQLCEQIQVADVPVAVRSSATSEDSPDASFAGEHDTYLWVRGGDQVISNVRRCWASLFTDRAVSYRVEMGYSHLDVEMCVAVQKMVRPRAAGVAFTLNPGDGDRSTIAIDSAWGFGEGVVSGEVTPDNFLVDKVIGSISRRTVSAKTHAFRLGDDEQVHRVELAPEEQREPSLTDDEIAAIAKLARAAERHYGCPQDIEWALDEDLSDGANVVLLQARPETVWSKKKVVVSTGADAMSSIVSTLVNPLYARKS